MKKSEVNKLLSILNREDLESAMVFIDTNGIPKGRQSNTFDVVSNLGKNYPPPFLLETAYKQKSGEELPIGFFDNVGKGSRHFKIIEDLGFNIMAKNQNMNKSNTDKFKTSLTLEELARELNSLSINKRAFNIICSAFIIKNDPNISSKDTTEKVRKIRVSIGMNEDFDNISGRIDQDCKYFPVKRFYPGNKDFVYAVRNNNLLNDYENSIKSNPSETRAIRELVTLLKKYVFIETNYWLFQGNPEVFDFESAIADGSLDNFTVSSHKHRIKVGDKVIIWIAGDRAGCYALAEIMSEPKEFKKSDGDKHWIEDKSRDLTVEINITHNLFSNPVLWDRIKALKEFKEFNGGNQGTNFRATEEEYNKLLSMATNNDYSWVKTHKGIVNYLKSKENQQIELIDLLKSIGVGPFDNDEDFDGNKIDLSEIDPFTFFFFIYKYGPEKRLKYLQELAKKLNVFIPSDESGIPSAQAQKVWLFSYLSTRKNNEIKKLWDLFYSALNESITDEQFDDVLTIRNTGKTKLTEGLFEVNPDRYFPINGPTKPYLKEVLNINPSFNTYAEYENILAQIKDKTDKPFYQISYEAWLWNNDQSSTKSDYHKLIKKFDKKKFNIYLEVLRTFVRKNNLSPNDEIVTFNIRPKHNRLTFIIGNRYSFILEKNKDKTEYGFVSKEQIEVNAGAFSDQFSDEDEVIYFNHVDDISQIKQVVYDGLQVELNRNHKAPARKYNNLDFANDVFQIEIMTDTSNKEKNNVREIALNQILYGPPGTGKTYALKKDYFPLYTDKDIQRYKFVTFHQSFSYEDFIEGIKPIMPENGDVAEDLGYKIVDGVFKDICKEAENNPAHQYAIFIDEINRGNVSAVFGELITLIETDKRKGAANAMSNTLPYSKKVFSVPSNLDIYGTMNTADRSVEALDTALRRRFEFKEMMPDLDVIENEEVDGILLKDVLKKINQRIELLVDRDHTIGHSYFVKVNTSKKLANAFNNKIVPLLQEYFYGDYGKIGLVLGKGFVEKIKNDKIEFANFDYENANDFKTPTFVLKPVNSTSVIEAVNILLGNLEEKEVS